MSEWAPTFESIGVVVRTVCSSGVTVRNGSVVGTVERAHPASLEALQPMYETGTADRDFVAFDPAINEVIARFAIDSRCRCVVPWGDDAWLMVEGTTLVSRRLDNRHTNVVARDVVDRSHVVVSIDVHGDHALLRSHVAEDKPWSATTISSVHLGRGELVARRDFARWPVTAIDEKLLVGLSRDDDSVELACVDRATLAARWQRQLQTRRPEYSAVRFVERIDDAVTVLCETAKNVFVRLDVDSGAVVQGPFETELLCVNGSIAIRREGHNRLRVSRGVFGATICCWSAVEVIDYVEPYPGRPDCFVCVTHSAVQLVQISPPRVLAAVRFRMLPTARPFVYAAVGRWLLLSSPVRVPVDLAPLPARAMLREIEPEPSRERAKVVTEVIEPVAGPPPIDRSRHALIHSLLVEEAGSWSAVWERLGARDLVDPGFDVSVQRVDVKGRLLDLRDSSISPLSAGVWFTFAHDWPQISDAMGLCREVMHRAAPWRTTQDYTIEFCDWGLTRSECFGAVLDRLILTITSVVFTERAPNEGEFSYPSIATCDALWQHASEAGLLLPASAPLPIANKPFRDVPSPFAPMNALQRLGISAHCVEDSYIALSIQHFDDRLEARRDG